MVNCGEERTKCYGGSCLMPKYRSKFEEQVCGQLTQQKIKFKYEPIKIKYVIPETNHTYIPDVILPNGIIIEIKGRLTKQDRFKHLYIQEQKPELDIRFVLQNYKVKLYKGSKTTYGEWLTKNNFFWSEKNIPIEWIHERRKERHTQNKNDKYVKNTGRSSSRVKL